MTQPVPATETVSVLRAPLASLKCRTSASTHARSVPPTMTASTPSARSRWRRSSTTPPATDVAPSAATRIRIPVDSAGTELAVL